MTQTFKSLLCKLRLHRWNYSGVFNRERLCARCELEQVRPYSHWLDKGRLHGRGLREWERLVEARTGMLKMGLRDCDCIVLTPMASMPRLPLIQDYPEDFIW